VTWAHSCELITKVAYSPHLQLIIVVVVVVVVHLPHPKPAPAARSVVEQRRRLINSISNLDEVDRAPWLAADENNAATKTNIDWTL